MLEIKYREIIAFPGDKYKVREIIHTLKARSAFDAMNLRYYRIDDYNYKAISKDDIITEKRI